MNEGKRKLFFLMGPTASGKTEVGVEVARCINAEIVSMDSMAVYRGMDIGTAKPSENLRSLVPHHLIDIIEPTDYFSVADYLRLAERKIEQISARGKQVLFVGGTALYLKALVEGIFDGPGANPELRERLRAEAESRGREALYERLQSVDPESARRIHPNDLRRIIRALEVYESTGSPLSSFQIQFGRPNERYACRVCALNPPRQRLKERIKRRVERMFEEGLVEEVSRIKEDTGFGQQASQALGYKEVLEYLDGQRSLEETIQLVKRRTWRFARQQMTWLRRFKSLRWVEVKEGEEVGQVAGRVAGVLLAEESPGSREL